MPIKRQMLGLERERQRDALQVKIEHLKKWNRYRRDWCEIAIHGRVGKINPLTGYVEFPDGFKTVDPNKIINPKG